MTVSRVQAVYATPAPIRTFGALLIAPNGVPRRMLLVCQDAFNDVWADYVESRKHDATHDAALSNGKRLALRGIQVSRTQGCPCSARFQAIARDLSTAQAADEREDRLIDRIASRAKRLASAIGRVFTARRPTSAAGRTGGQR